ncbi:MAG TPA: fructosamine kinase family protein [Solirubrobacteraceae bacterium]|nr:fructosamine kinase family protein [Solirubrobacteraceae bacterium]
MTLPSSIAGRAVTASRRIAGGDINDAYAVELDGGTRAFVKTRDTVAAGEYATEAAALRWLGEPGAIRVPGVLEAGEDFLALEWLDEDRLDAEGEEELGRGLALVHAAGADRLGAAPPGAGSELRLGPLLLPNDPAPDWPAFYAERRLLPLLERARLSRDGRAAVERVCSRIHDLAGPPEPPARLHGDLWSGNVLASGGRPYLIDPAAYGGHREVDLAMLRLFGSPGPCFLAAYEEVAPLAPGHEDRVELYQLFPLLVHAALFGGGYAASAERAARRYAG